MMKTRIATEFFWVGNHSGIDLVNTEAVDANGHRLELLPDWTAVVDWAQAADLIDTGLAEQCRAAGERRGRKLLAWCRRLRSSLRNVLETGEDEALATALDDDVAAVSVRLSYRPARHQHELPIEAPGPLEQLRLALASTALDAASLERSRVRCCGSPRCVLLYYDATKNRSRRWCDMAVCGNRAKANAHYRRAKHGESISRHPTT
jgi:predicted RNA-binding Zn ribbon-like protein